MTRTRCGVLGSPIAHSLSPQLHRAAYAALGLDWEYDAHEVDAADLADFLDGLDGRWRGLSLTMPLKRAVLPHLDDVSDRAALAGAANTVVLDGARRVGDNTDIPGAAAALREHYAGPLRRATVVGGGATAASVSWALADLGCELVTLLVRDPDRAAGTVAVLGRHPRSPSVEVRPLGAEVPGADVVVSTVPATAHESLLRLARQCAVLFDVVYDPWPTPLAVAAQASGAVVVSGHDLLVHQAALQVELMTGRAVGVNVLRAALEPVG